MTDGRGFNMIRSIASCISGEKANLIRLVAFSARRYKAVLFFQENALL
jgi:hypothetical protein